MAQCGRRVAFDVVKTVTAARRSSRFALFFDPQPQSEGMMMRGSVRSAITIALFVASSFLLPSSSLAEVKVWEETVTIPTYPWEDDVNPKFWAMEGGPGLSTTIKGSITYPYTMQDHLSRTKVDRTYKALFLENKYLKVICLPELGGRLHSVVDKAKGEEMFHTNGVIKPGMIAMRGAWIGGGVEWNSGPHGHTVTAVSPVNALAGKNSDGSAFLEISNREKLFRTRWVVRVTLHPGRSYLDEKIRISNPTDGFHPYYFWNCTAFPCRDGTRFIYPMTLGTDHHGREFFNWPVHEGKDLTWLKNYEAWASVFAVDCSYDFFGAYDVDADRGIVQTANHHQLPGKKAWTWGSWDFGLVAQQNLTDDDGPYIEVQSGPLPTQSDYGMLTPRKEIAWQEWWYPVHGLGDGFEFANADLAVQTSRTDGNLELKLLATGEFPGATCYVSHDGLDFPPTRVDLSPANVGRITLDRAGKAPVDVAVKTADGTVLAEFTTPLPIPVVNPPDPSKFEEKPDDSLTVQEKFLKGRAFDRATNRQEARRYYELALAQDPSHVASLRALAVLDAEAGLYLDAIPRLEKALDRDGDDGFSWFFLGHCHLRRNEAQEALHCGFQAARCPGTDSIGYDLAGRAYMRLGEHAKAVDTFREAVWSSAPDTSARQHMILAYYMDRTAPKTLPHVPLIIKRHPSSPILRAVVALGGKEEMDRFVRWGRDVLGEYEFEMLETSLVFAEVGLFEQAARLLSAACVETVPEAERSPLPLYYLAYFASQAGNDDLARESLKQAAGIWRDFVFPSRPEAVDVFEYAIAQNPNDASAHLHLGNLLAGLGRVEEAVPHWRKAAELNPKLSIAFRNLGLAAAALEDDLAKAAEAYRKAIVARPGDQTLYRDLAEILIGDEKRPQAIEVLTTMPVEGTRRADVTILLAQAYLDEERYADALDLLESTPYFVHWEGQDVTWVVFNKAHVARGRKRLEAGDAQAALADFEAALTYPANLGVGRSDQPSEAAAQYWRGKALETLGRGAEARDAWKLGAAGHEDSDVQNEHIKLCKDALAKRESL